MTTHAGLSAFSLYVPPYRVALERWCEWTEQPWPKVHAVSGRSFRLPGPDENVYTMAATAVMRLLEAEDIDPESVGMLAFGTESSTDNAAGAVILRGMVDRRLEATGRARLSRRCEVPEMKHACLGGMYALKSALRYVATDGRHRRAIVVCGDVAEYERGSTGEPTQGAGAVAMLVEPHARLLEIDLSRAGSASAYRGPDFRKPMARHFADGYAARTKRHHDFPVFSGKYSTYAYLDATVAAVDDLVARHGGDAMDLFSGVRALFFHRPYRMMPLSAMSFLMVRAMAQHPPSRDVLAEACATAGVATDDVVAEADLRPDLFERLSQGEMAHPYPATAATASAFRKGEVFRAFADDKLGLGADTAMDLGNLYTAALPAWLAAGLEEAAARDEALAGRDVLAVGYGSGDAAEAWPMRVVANWSEAASRLGIRRALEGAVDLDRHDYELLHDEGRLDRAPRATNCFAVERIGERHDPGFQDLGVEYYAYVP
ncbi:MAG: hydroxymethylglutaryl-CoA synthase [Myxococcota bacterium]